ncbi:glycerate kinase [Paenibacillus harenae]|uniref:Glycerate kinase n=1 Tax=Paenibacillus harenae TaxID=306543 RepID=A0ABT9TTT0_PAEHA|nr:glycerate kinase [Paenibacillus harenae]MDQ0110758.1 glycerate kinase [Paenibacillus harenae]
MKVVLAFDSFKGSLSSEAAGRAASRAVRSVFPDASCDVIPLADGGEGTVAAVVEAADGSYATLQVTGPLGKETPATIGLIHKEKAEGPTAVLEVASLCGLTMVPESERDPYRTSSKGVGEAIIQLLDRGIRSFVVGLGGSATNDGGMGMLAALGASFTDRAGNRLLGYGGDLASIASIEWSGIDSRLKESAIKIATDVSNPLCGPTGATMVYGKQKGASPEQQASLERAMTTYADRIEGAAGSSWRLAPGAGAAGGLGFALLALGGEVVSGARWLIDAVALRERIRDADWVITGEGRSDNQTIYGKLPVQVAAAASETGTKCMLLSGSLGDELGELEERFDGCFSIVKAPVALEACMEQAEELLEQTVRQLFRLLRAAR